MVSKKTQKKHKKIYPGTKNMIPLNKRSKEEARKIQSKGGKAGKNNPNLKVARKIQWLKRKGFNDEYAYEILQMMTDHQFSSLDILQNIKKIISMCEDTKEQMMAQKLMMEWYKLHHGDKKIIDMKIKQVDLEEPISEEYKKILLEE